LGDTHVSHVALSLHVAQLAMQTAPKYQERCAIGSDRLKGECVDGKLSPPFPKLSHKHIFIACKAQHLPEHLPALGKYWPVGHAESHVPFTVMT
jgi:hypothetical protein